MIKKSATIFDIMSDSPEKADEFKLICDDTLNSQYILAETKISAILQSIAASKILYTLMESILKSFDYKEAASQWRESNFIMPEEPKKIAGLAFCILLEIDKKTIILKDFIPFITGETDLNVAYESFLKKVILPFKNSVSHLLNAAADNAKLRKEAIEIEQGRLRRREEFEKLIGIFVARIKSDMQLGEIAKDEISGLGGELVAAVRGNDGHEAQRAHMKLCKKVKAYKPKLLAELNSIELPS